MGKGLDLGRREPNSLPSAATTFIPSECIWQGPLPLHFNGVGPERPELDRHQSDLATIRVQWHDPIYRSTTVRRRYEATFPPFLASRRTWLSDIRYERDTTATTGTLI